MLDTEFIEKLAASDPTPGGGGASAYCGAIAASLASMVGNLTLGKAKFADIEQEVIGAVARLSVLRSRLVELVEKDAEAFEPLSKAYRMPRETEAQSKTRNCAIQEGLFEASQPPLDMMRALIDVLHECDFLARNGNRMAISDAGACALIAKSALLSASLNIYINVESMTDRLQSQNLRDEADKLIEQGIKMSDDIYSYVASQIDAYQIG